MWQTILGLLLAALLAGLLVRHLLRAEAARRAEPERLFRDAMPVLDNAEPKAGETAGTFLLAGTFRGHEVRVTALADTLAVRKLPGLWLMITLPGPLPVTATLDMMMRPAGVTSFSNFDLLPFSLETPPGFPAHLVARSDQPEPPLPFDIVARHIGPLEDRRGKELLITPKGLRLVMLLAEADRARYGVFRQADFGGATVDPELLSRGIEHLLDLRQDILTWHDQQA